MSAHQAVSSFVLAAESLWQRYLATGPGKMAASEHNSVATALPQAIQALAEHDELVTAAQRIHELTRRCAARPEGLCFITGEAGLIPRKDQHEELDKLLQLLREFTERPT